MLQFLIRAGESAERTVNAAVSPVFAGSEPGLPIHISDPAAAPRHFSVEVHDLGVILRDLGSPSGTRVNGEFVSQVRLSAGDEIRVGDVVVVFKLQSAAPAPPPIAPAPAPVFGPAPPAAPRIPRERPVRRKSPAAAVTLVLFCIVAVGAAIFLMKDILREPPRPVAKAPVRVEEAVPLPAAEPAPADLSGLPPPYVPPPVVPGEPAEPVFAPPKAEPPAPVPAAPAERPPEKPPTPAGPSPEEQEVRRREALAREALDRFDETVADRLARYAFSSLVEDLGRVRDEAPPGPVRDRVDGRLDDLARAARAYGRMKEVLAAGDGRKVTLESGLSLTVTGADDEGFSGKSGRAVMKVRYLQLSPGDVWGIVEDVAATAEDWLDASALGALLGLPPETWEDDLIRAFRKDPDSKPEIDAALARRRGTVAPPGGFLLFEGGWVTPEERDYLERGYVRHEGKWLTEDEYRTALGWVRVDGRWLTPEQHERYLEGQRASEELAAKYMPKGLIDLPDHGAAVPWAKALELKTRHYRIRTNLDRDVAKDIAYTMEILNSNLKSVFGLRGKGAAFTVNVVANRSEYTGEWPRAGGSLGFTSTGEICTYYQPPMTTAVLMHEGTHQILRTFAPSCPRWLHEGMATYFECSRFRFDPDRRRVELEVGLLNAMRLAGFQAQIRSGAAVSLETFIRGAGGDPYQQGWAFVYYLAKGADGRYAARLHEFVQEAHKRDVVERFQRIFKVRDLAAFEAEWREYMLSLDPAEGIRVDSPHR